MCVFPGLDQAGVQCAAGPGLCGKLAGGFRGAELALLCYAIPGIWGVIALLYHVTGADTWKKQAVVLAALLACGSITSLCDFAAVVIQTVSFSKPEIAVYESIYPNFFAGSR